HGCCQDPVRDALADLDQGLAGLGRRGYHRQGLALLGRLPEVHLPWHHPYRTAVGRHSQHRGWLRRSIVRSLRFPGPFVRFFYGTSIAFTYVFLAARGTLRPAIPTN